MDRPESISRSTKRSISPPRRTLRLELTSVCPASAAWFGAATPMHRLRTQWQRQVADGPLWPREPTLPLVPVVLGRGCRHAYYPPQREVPTEQCLGHSQLHQRSSAAFPGVPPALKAALFEQGRCGFVTPLHMEAPSTGRIQRYSHFNSHRASRLRRTSPSAAGPSGHGAVSRLTLHYRGWSADNPQAGANGSGICLERRALAKSGFIQQTSYVAVAVGSPIAASTCRTQAKGSASSSGLPYWGTTMFADSSPRARAASR